MAFVLCQAHTIRGCVEEGHGVVCFDCAVQITALLGHLSTQGKTCANKCPCANQLNLQTPRLTLFTV